MFPKVHDVVGWLEVPLGQPLAPFHHQPVKSPGFPISRFQQPSTLYMYCAYTYASELDTGFSRAQQKRTTRNNRSYLIYLPLVLPRLNSPLFSASLPPNDDDDDEARAAA